MYAGIVTVRVILKEIARLLLRRREKKKSMKHLVAILKILMMRCGGRIMGVGFWSIVLFNISERLVEEFLLH